MRNELRGLFSLVIAVLSLRAEIAKASTELSQTMPKSLDVDAILASIAAKHSISEEAARKALLASLLNSKFIATGDRGVLAKDLLVDLDPQKNRVYYRHLGAGITWDGTKQGSVETVVFILRDSEWSVNPILENSTLYETVVIFFSKDRVSFINFSTGSGGFYLRKK